MRSGIIGHPPEITDVWRNAYRANSNAKIWAAKFAARHPNLIGMEIGSFRCGHDAPISSTIESIIESSGTPFFSFRDLDENKPSGSIKIRVETIHYFLRRYREGLVNEAALRRRPFLLLATLKDPEHAAKKGSGPDPTPGKPRPGNRL